MARKKEGKKNRKVGRNANYCKFYALTHRRERNKLVKLKKHLKKFPNDKSALAAVETCKFVLGLH